jgi:hypothetical protein
MDIKNAKVIKAGIVFLIVMAFFTIFSRGIINLLTPKVIISRPTPYMVRNDINTHGEIIVGEDGVLLVKAVIPADKIDDYFMGRYAEFQFLNPENDTVRFMSGEVSYIDFETGEIHITPGRALPDGTERVFGLTIALSFDSYDFTVPSTAIVGWNTLYVIERRDGILGEELYIRSRAVTVEMERDGRAMLSREGIAWEDFIVIGWDRPLKDGQRVMLPYD